MRRGTFGALAAVVLLAGCTSSTNVASNSPAASPTPSPSPTPIPSPTVAATPAAIGGIPLPVGEVGIAYSTSVTATGGPGPYTFSIDSGALPAGLNLGGDGSVSGTPTAAGTFNLSIKATDAQAEYTTKAVVITIAPQLTASLLPQCATACYVEQGCVNVCGAFGQQAGGVAPFKYQASGNIPGGMKDAGFQLIGSFPQLAQFWQFSVTVTDSLGATATITPTFYVYRHISVASGSCLGNYITGCTAQLAITGGNPNGRFSVKLVANAANPNQGCWAPGPPPAGYALTAGGGVVIVVIPKQIINGYGAVWTIVVTDQSVCGNGVYCTSPAATVVIGVQCG